RLTGNLTPVEIDQLTTNLLIDPVVQEAKNVGVSLVGTLAPLSLVGTPAPLSLVGTLPYAASQSVHLVDVFFLPGVTDTLAESVIVGAHMLGISGLEHVETGRRYILDSRLSEADVRTIAEALLYNPVIQYFTWYAAENNG